MAPPLPATALASELELAQQARGGDRQALDQLYRRHREQLVRHALRLLQDEAEARDVVQEAFARALQALPRTRPGLRFRPWIFRITTNLCLRHLNRRRRWVLGEHATWQRDPGPDPERARRRTERVALLTAALSAMPKRYRRILLLREQQGLSYDELARALDLDRNRVKVTLHRARARLWALFLAHQLGSEPLPQAIACEELRKLLRAGSRQARLVRHLESCGTCRERERRRAAELVALLPPLSPRPRPAPSPPPPPVVLWPAWVATLALVGLVAVGVGLSPTEDAGGTPAAATQTPAVARVWSHPGPPDAALPNPRALEPGGPHPKATAVHTPQPRRTVRDAPPRASKPLAPPPGWPSLDIRLRHRPGDLQIQRGGLLLAADPLSLRLGDVLVGGAVTPFSVLLPGGQWLQVRGQLRLDAAPLRGQPPRRVQVALLSGELRARARRAGRGLQIGLGRSRCQVQRGELLARSIAAGVFRVEVLDAYATLRGPHAPRVLPPRTGLDLTRPVGFAHRLLPAPLHLSPAPIRSPDPPRLSWSPTPGAAAYHVLLAHDPAFRRLHGSPGRTQQASLAPGPLPPGRYYWRVVALRGHQQSVPSRTHSFTVTPPVAANAR